MAIGFVANQPPTPEVVDGIRFIMTFAPAAACAIAAVVLYCGYRPEDKAIIQMQDEIAERKANALASV